MIDDDVELPRGFLDRFLFLCERFSLALAQPAHRLDSHAAWSVTRRRAGSVVRETSFVEIGPVTAFARITFPVLLPFPELRMGWGLDVALGRARARARLALRRGGRRRHPPPRGARRGRLRPRRRPWRRRAPSSPIART